MPVRSIWSSGIPASAASLADNAEVEIAIVGAGVAGLTAAYLLTRQGYDVHVFDSGAPAGGMTSRSTSHIATALDDGWRAAVKSKGVDGARLIADAYIQAVRRIARIVRDERIDCDFSHCDGLLVGSAEDLEDELSAAQRVGIAAAWSSWHPLGASDNDMAVRFPDQGRLHPLKYARGLLAHIQRNGGHIHRATITRISPSIDGAAQAMTADGTRILAAKAVILATNSGLCFPPSSAAQRTTTSYVIAGYVPKGATPDVICWDSDDPYHYTRLQPFNATTDYLIIGGEDHDANVPANSTQRFAVLEAWARRNFPAITEVAARWHGQIRQPADNLGFLGRDPTYPGIYIIDGDGGLGFTHATLGALMIRDLLAGRRNAWTDIFNPQRYGPLRHELVVTSDAMRVAG